MKKIDKTLLLHNPDMGVLLVVIGAVCSGLRPLFARLLLDDGITVTSTAFYCYLGSCILFLPYGVRELKQTSEKEMTVLLSIVAGIIVGTGSMAYFEALRRLPIATVILIYFTYPAFVIILLAIIHQRLPQLKAWFGVMCTLAGIWLIVGSGIENASHALIDYAIAFIAPLSWTILILSLGGPPLNRLKPFSRIGFISSGAVLTIAVFLFFQETAVQFPSSQTGWIGLICMVFISGTLCHVFTTVGVESAGAERCSFAGAFEIAVSLGIGWVVFTEAFYITQAAGILFIYLALVLTRRLEIDSFDPPTLSGGPCCDETLRIKTKGKK